MYTQTSTHTYVFTPAPKHMYMQMHNDMFLPLFAQRKRQPHGRLVLQMKLNFSASPQYTVITGSPFSISNASFGSAGISIYNLSPY